MSNYSRSRTRKFLYQMLYATSFWKLDEQEFRESFFSWVFDSNLDEEYLNKIYKIILEKEWFFIEVIKKFAPKFDIENMDLSYIIPVYIWVWELVFLDWDIPEKVSINESIEIAKIYWDDSSKKIVNWILNNVIKNLDELKNESKNFDYSKKGFFPIWWK